MTEERSTDREEKRVRRQYRRTKERRQEILVTVVRLLSEPSCGGVTTKEIAKAMGVADGALYRHFTGKTEILLELIDFCRRSFEGMFNEINAQTGVGMIGRAEIKARALLLFAEANPGLTRLLTGEALCGESAEVKTAMRNTLAAAEKSIAQTLELADVQREAVSNTDFAGRAALVMSYIQGRWSRFVASGFDEKPAEDWTKAKAILVSGLQHS